ncbi:hypothetical protein E3N88_30204 [Mikania micrantha]|uniref:Uncharacterized protein n=1 Tax=Mikania micrantha TaxID=192012 RepID=A0A5N6MKX7_9ASTR|nr:hypothetical protein E3N88_30204 [Mikania micrantha]
MVGTNPDTIISDQGFGIVDVVKCVYLCSVMLGGEWIKKATKLPICASLRTAAILRRDQPNHRRREAQRPAVVLYRCESEARSTKSPEKGRGRSSSCIAVLETGGAKGGRL